MLLGRGFLGFLELLLTLDVPFGVTSHLTRWYLLGNTSLISIILPFLELLAILLVVHAVELPHLLDLVQVDHEAFLVRVVLLDALSTEDGQMV